MNFENKIIPNFCSDEELAFLDKFIVENTTAWKNYLDPKYQKEGDEPVLNAVYHSFPYYHEIYKPVYDILEPKFREHFGDIYIGEIHVFDSYDPYMIHTDIESGIVENHAWTFIIPLDNYDSHTIVFKEGSMKKDMRDYMATHEPYPENTIDEATYKKYFTHCSPEYFKYLTIDEIFKWEKGALFAASRYRHHTSDNFIANGLKEKRAIVAWTNTKKPDNL